jgi:acetone carboxylase gamma subunit
MTCSFCNKPINIGDRVQVVPPICEVRIGPKSGQPFLLSEQGENEVIHLECAPGFFDPEFNAESHDQLVERIRAEVIDEEFESIKEAAMQEVADMHGNICSECYEEIEATNS